jgi:hypothetical protein
MNRFFINEKKVWTFSLTLSVIVNIVILAAISIYWLSMKYEPQPREEPIVIQVLEIPAPRKPVTTIPQKEEVNVAELNPLKDIRNEVPINEPQIKSEISTELKQKKEQVSVPKPPVNLPDSEMISEKGSPSGAKLVNPGEEINVPENLKWQGVEAENTIKAQFENAGQSTRLAHLAQEGADRIESTVGETLATGELTAPTGLIDKKSPFSKRPISVIIENAPAARPQSGLSKADIVYEIMAEGGITRFLAIYNEGVADNVGPVRSARPYFVMKAAEHNAIFAHVGGSVEAYVYMKEMNVDAIDEFKFFQAFWRSKDRKAPHNLYTSVANLRNQAQLLGYNKPVKGGGFPIRTPQEALGTKDAPKVEIVYAGDYTVKFTWDAINRVYRRYINDKPHIDSLNGQQITTTNIIIQMTEQKVKDKEGRIEITFVGKGAGWILLDGKVAPIRWEKNSLGDKTRYFYADGRELKINPGTLWIEVVSTQNKVVM